MSEATFTFRVDEALKAKFTEAAKARDRTGAQLLRDFMRGVVSQQQGAAEYDAWFRREVEAALAESDDPDTRWVSNEQAKQESAAWRRACRPVLRPSVEADVVAPGAADAVRAVGVHRRAEPARGPARE